jgi:hypothetical protein
MADFLIILGACWLSFLVGWKSCQDWRNYRE